VTETLSIALLELNIARIATAIVLLGNGDTMGAYSITPMVTERAWVFSGWL
jgi:hypothetical protein